MTDHSRTQPPVSHNLSDIQTMRGEDYERFVARQPHLPRGGNPVLQSRHFQISHLTQAGHVDINTDGLDSHMVCIPFEEGTHIVARQRTFTQEGPVAAGQITLLPAGCPVKWTVQAPATVSTMNILLHPGLLQERSGASLPALKEVRWFRNVQMLRLAAILRDELQTGSQEGLLFVESIVHSLAVVLANHYAVESDAPPALKPGRAEVRAIVALLLADLTVSHSLEGLAAHVALSPAHLRRLFKAETGQSLYAFFLAKRLERAHALLCASANRSVTEVALTCGFYDASHLSRHFLRVYGCAPGQLQRK